MKISQTTPMPVFCWTDKTLKSTKSKTRSFRRTLGLRHRRKKAPRRRNGSANECFRYWRTCRITGLLKIHHCCSFDELLEYNFCLALMRIGRHYYDPVDRATIEIETNNVTRQTINNDGQPSFIVQERIVDASMERQTREMLPFHPKF